MAWHKPDDARTNGQMAGAKQIDASHERIEQQKERKRTKRDERESEERTRE
jgi:hypothetical protein